MGTNIKTLIFNGLKSILENNANIGIDTVIYIGEERVFPCIEIATFNDSHSETYSCFELWEGTFIINVLTRDNFNFVDGKFDDVDAGDSKDGSASYADNVVSEIKNNYKTEIPALIDLQFMNQSDIEQDGEIIGEELEFMVLYERAR